MSKIYLVGGAIRDRLLDLPVTERDWVVVGATPNELLGQGYQQVGKDFPVFLHPKTKEEYALARTERKSGKGYTGFICDFGKEITLEQDLIRRDLTVNAIAQDEQGQLFDPYHGIDDIHRKILRHISPAFGEDPLRVLRVARFAARYHHLGFTIADETMTLMTQIVTSKEIANLTAERVWKETEKALSTQDPQIYFQTLEQCGALAALFPEIKLTDTLMDALKNVTQLTQEREIRFALLCSQLDNRQLVNQLCSDIKAPNNYRKVAQIVQQHYQSIQQIEQFTAEQILQLLNTIDVWRHPHHLQQLIIASQAYFHPKNSQNSPYRQGDFLKQAYKIANSVNVQAIISQGLTGQAIHIELQKQRIALLSDWICLYLNQLH
ncbi:hypothetical protein PT273_05100 [Orbaceae bacterium ESL0727]|nr:hypothetical protein [Orbaceae bacterium ESL0727]